MPVEMNAVLEVFWILMDRAFLVSLVSLVWVDFRRYCQNSSFLTASRVFCSVAGACVPTSSDCTPVPGGLSA